MASATASASGGNGTDSNGKSTDGIRASNSKVAGQASDASGKEGAAGVGSSDQQSAGTATAAKENGQGSTGGKSVAVAAAIGIEAVQADVTALVPIAVGIDAKGGLSVTAVGNVDAGTIANGSAVGTADATATVGIGAGVAITLAHAETDATLGSAGATGQTYTAGSLTAGRYAAGSLTVSALQTDQNIASPGVPVAGVTAPGPRRSRSPFRATAPIRSGRTCSGRRRRRGRGEPASGWRARLGST